MITRLRPNASDRGPVKNVPMPMPSTKDVRISCALFNASGLSSRPISGSAGNIASIENAITANIIAIKAINSTRDMDWFMCGAMPQSQTLGKQFSRVYWSPFGS